MSYPATADRKSVADIIRKQIQTGIFMSLGASNLGHIASTGQRDYEMAGLLFVARILPFKKNGERSERPSKMAVEILLNAGDLYDIEVYTIKNGERVYHWRGEDITVFDLNRTLLALDYDGDTALNPRYV